MIASTFPPALSASTGLDLGSYRADHVAERIRRAIERERVADVTELVQLLRSDMGARARFRRSVAVSVSGLFRDPAQFDVLERDLLPPLVADDRRVPVWSAGCSDGSELYSVGLLLERLGALDRALLLGSDVLDESVTAARRGVYGDWRAPDRVKARTHWERRDIVREGAPPGEWRLVLCRNVAIYLAPTARRALHETLAASLASRGVLLLGRSERLSSPQSLGLERVAPHAYRRTT